MSTQGSILFVDDDPRILEGLRHALYKERHRWDMVFVQGGAAALAQLHARAFDVVVVDLEMPDLDGVKLLAAVQQARPSAVRIMLSAQPDHASLIRSMSPVHQVLGKPCEPEQLRSALERSLDGIAQRGDAAARQLVGELTQLPSPPEIYLQLSQLTRSPRATARDAARVIGTDPAMTAKVLQIANSSYFGATRPILAVSDAVHLFGFERLRAIALSEGAFRVHAGAARSRHVIQKMQRTGLLVAELASAFVAPAAREQVFASALLHDVGYVVLALQASHALDALIERVDRGDDARAAELGALGVTHGEIAAKLLAFWGLPPALGELIKFHHEPGDAPSELRELASAIHVADAICSNPVAPEIDADSVARAGASASVPRWLELGRAKLSALCAPQSVRAHR